MVEQLEALVLLVTGVIALIVGYYGSYYLIFKQKLSEFRGCVNAVDEALKDDTVSEEEFRDVWNRCYTFFKNLGGG